MSTALDPATYWQLRALTADADGAQAAAALAHSRADQARARRLAYWREVAARQNLDPDATYAASDEHCTLTPT